MPRSLRWLLDHQHELTERFENFDPDSEGADGNDAYAQLLRAASRRLAVEDEVVDAVLAARDAGYSWGMIGRALGTMGTAVQQSDPKEN